MPNDQGGKEIDPRTEGDLADRPSVMPVDGRGAEVMPVETLQEQADHLGLLDPLDVEPAHVYVPDGSTT